VKVKIGTIIKRIFFVLYSFKIMELQFVCVVLIVMCIPGFNCLVSNFLFQHDRT